MTDGKFVLQEKKLKATFRIDVKPSKLSELKNDLDLVNKEYVDEAIKNVEVDLTDYATIDYVDNAIKNVEVDLTGYATTEYVDEAIANVEIDTSNLATKDEINAVSAEIPKKTSQLTNDSGFITSSSLNGYATEEYVDTAIANVEVDTSNLATKDELSTVEAKIPTKVSELQNDSNFVNATTLADTINPINTNITALSDKVEELEQKPAVIIREW